MRCAVQLLSLATLLDAKYDAVHLNAKYPQVVAQTVADNRSKACCPPVLRTLLPLRREYYSTHFPPVRRTLRRASSAPFSPSSTPRATLSPKPQLGVAEAPISIRQLRAYFEATSDEVRMLPRRHEQQQ